MALKKSELYSSLWSSCDELRVDLTAGKFFGLGQRCTPLVAYVSTDLSCSIL